ncbi:MAG: transketolase [Candidatus Cloacimonetes bacterium]|nr:transketolase [Candidatus Cloacimonadota bacterium]
MTDNETISRLQQQAAQARAAILSMTTLAASGHPGGSMSSIDILLALYSLIKHDPANPWLEDRDRIVVSNGHISPGVYAALGLSGYHDLDEAVSQFRLAGSIYEGHIEREVAGVEWSSGNLGQGLSAAAGMALASRIKNVPYRVWTLMGDGEQQKGQISEARRFAIKYGLNNLAAIVDYNRLQISGNIDAVMPQNIRRNWESDGWKVLEIDGHDFAAIFSALASVQDAGLPTMILAHTVMGKGVPFMEDQAKYHGSALSEEQLDEALKILDQPNPLDKYRKLRESFQAPDPEPDHSIFELNCSLQPGQPTVYDKTTDNRSAWGAAIADLARINSEDPTPIVVVDCDLMGSVKTGDFAKDKPGRFIQAGIMEHNAAVLSGALSSCGIQTFWADFGMFGLDEVYNLQRLNDINHTNLKVALTHVGLDVGEDGKTHQCIDYIGLLRNLFSFRLICPADPNQTDRVIRWLIDKPGNYVVTMGRSKLPVIRGEDGQPFYGLGYSFQYGRADILRPGNKATLFVTGTPAANAVEAVDKLREQGLFLQLVYVSSPLQIDSETLVQAARKGLIFSVEDHNVHSGLGSVVADRMVALRLSAPLVKIGVQGYCGSGSSKDLYQAAGLDAASIAERVLAELKNIG